MRQASVAVCCRGVSDSVILDAYRARRSPHAELCNNPHPDVRKSAPARFGFEPDGGAGCSCLSIMSIIFNSDYPFHRTRDR